jgi:fibronectin type 3 domain-containing protein
VFAVSCGVKDGPYLPKRILSKPAKNFQVSVRSEGVLLRWKAPLENTDGTPLLNLGGFRIFRAETAFEKICLSCPRDFSQIFDYHYMGTKNKIPEGARFFYLDTALEFKNLYTYKLQTYDENGDAGLSTGSVDVYWDEPPLKPDKVLAQKSGRLTTVSWDAPLTNEDGTPAEKIYGYNLYRSEKTGEDSLFPLNNEVLKETAVEDIPPEDEKVYYYSVRAVRKVKDTLVESASSREVAVSYMDTSPPGIPTGLAAIPVENGVLLKWIPKAEKDFSGFNIYRKTAKEKNFVKINTSLVKAASWVDVDVNVKHRYVYAVTSVDSSAAANESDFSEPVKVYYIFK